MGEWKKVKLGDCIKEVVEKTTENNQYEVLTSSKNGIFSQEEYFDKQVASKNNVGYKIIKKGQFTYRSMSDSGSFTINRLENKDIGIVSPAYPVFEVKEINPDYLKYFFDSEMFRKAIHNLSQGSTRTALKYKDLIEIEMLLPTIEEQIKIVKILEKVDLIIKKYEKLLKEKNQFIKSKFIEMFERTNEGEKTKVEDICREMKIGPFGSALHKKEIRENGEVFVLGTDNAVDNEFKIYEKRYIDNDKYQQLIKYTAHDGDIIISMMGTIGKTAIIPDGFGKAIISSHLCYLTPDSTKITSRFLNNMFKYSSSIKYQISKQQRGAVMNGLNLKIIKNLEFNLPSMDMQKKFEIIVKLIDKQKLELKKIIENYQKLKKGLMQQLLTGKIKVKI